MPDTKTIYLAGGCFWGVEAYFEGIEGVLETEVGYANGDTEHTSYGVIGQTGHAEAVRVAYDPKRIALGHLLEYYLRIVDPTAVDRQGPDVGRQYRTGVYFVDPVDEPVIRASLDREQSRHASPIAIEVERLSNWVVGEEYHQEYLRKNPGGYCHVDLSTRPVHRPDAETPEELAARLTPIQYEVTQRSGTEAPYTGETWDTFEPGIYIDIVDGTPLFVSSDKFEAGCGWPSFSRPIDRSLLAERLDRTYGMLRMEVRSRGSDAHLGHVFTDGPEESGGLRYCINSTSLEFVPRDDMAERGFEDLIDLVDRNTPS